MDILIDKDNVIVCIGENIEFGFLDESEPDIEKWKITENLFAIDAGFTCVKNLTLPAHIQEYKYCYKDGTFSINPNYREPVNEYTLQQQITELQLALAELIEGSVV